MMITHQNTGFIILGLTVILAAWSFWRKESATAEEAAGSARPLRLPKAPWAFLLTAALATYLVLQNGDIGSRMVFLQGAAVKPMAHMLQGSHEHGGGGGHEHSSEGEKSEAAGADETPGASSAKGGASPSPQAEDGHSHTH